MKEVLVFTATYNEADNVGSLVAAIFEALPNCDLLIVDDNSPDGTGRILDELKAWLEQTLPTLSQKSAMAKAIQYSLNRWEALKRYCDDGRIEIDNNAAERALRCVALGRKNFLFAGSDAGGERAAALYSLLGTAKLNGYNPEAFLREVLTRIADLPIQRIGELLPWNLEPASTNALSADHATAALSA